VSCGEETDEVTVIKESSDSSDDNHNTQNKKDKHHKKKHALDFFSSGNPGECACDYYTTKKSA